MCSEMKKVNLTVTKSKQFVAREFKYPNEIFQVRFRYSLYYFGISVLTGCFRWLLRLINAHFKSSLIH